MYQLPINLLLKDNADDIKEKIERYKVHPIIDKIMNDCQSITSTYSNHESIAAPKQLSFQDLKNNCQAVFIALHGRPGEDGAIQKELEKVELPYNGSRTDSSEITINKFLTNEILMKHGFHVAQHSIASKENFKKDTESFIKEIESKFTFPFIAKPVDDGCSSAVRKVKTDEELKAFANLIFREVESLDEKSAQILKNRFSEKKIFSNINLVEAAVSSEIGKILFYEEPGCGESSSLIQNFSNESAIEKQVDVTTLDHEIKIRNLEHIDMLKIDAVFFARVWCLRSLCVCQELIAAT
jgi:D-alanine-D-alanine ligase